MLQILIYVGALVAANMTATAFGPMVTPLVGFALIGLDLTLRDELHDQWEGRRLWARMLGLITVAGLVSYLLNPASKSIAIASVVAFSAAALIDTLVYMALHGCTRAQRVNGSNVAAAAVDSLLFPALAFGAFLPVVSLTQFGAKVAGGALWLLILKNRRAAA